MTIYPSDMSFSSTHANKRREAAQKNMGEGTVQRLIAFGLFLLGAKREDIARYMEIPLGTLLSFLTRMDIHGPAALQDRRSTKARSKEETQPRCSVKIYEDQLHISIGAPGCKLTVPVRNPLQCKSVLLTFLDNGLLATKEVAKAVGLSPRRVRGLSTAMGEKDILALLDQRKGQKTDYRFTPEVKSELFQQFAANAITGKSTSSRAIAENLQQRCSMDLPDRSIRLHLRKLGLPRIAQTLPALIQTLKKNSSL